MASSLLSLYLVGVVAIIFAVVLTWRSIAHDELKNQCDQVRKKMTSKDKKRRRHSSLKKIYGFMMKKLSAISRRSLCFLAENCRRLFNKDHQPTNTISMFLLYLFAVVAIIAAVSVLTWRPNADEQVFLNFRGEELRYNFVSHLTEALGRNKINFFIDKNEPRGSDLENLFVRIEESNIAIAIFSPRYSQSSWCMDELVKMKELSKKEKLIVIPIFYKVKAEYVSKPTIDNEFGKNFKNLTKTSRASRSDIKKWKEALGCISNKAGLPLREESSEADFVKEIVMEVKKVIEARRWANMWCIKLCGLWRLKKTKFLLFLCVCYKILSIL